MQHKYPTIQFFVTIIWFLFDIIIKWNFLEKKKKKKKEALYLYLFLQYQKKIVFLQRLKLYYVSPPPCLVTVLGKSTHALCTA